MSILTGAVIGLGLRLLLVGNRPAAELASSTPISFMVFPTLGGAAVLVCEAWYRPSRRRGIKFGLGLAMIGAAAVWFVPFPA